MAKDRDKPLEPETRKWSGLSRCGDELLGEHPVCPRRRPLIVKLDEIDDSCPEPLSDVVKSFAAFPSRRSKVVHNHYSSHFPLFPTRHIIAIHSQGERDQAALRESLRKGAHAARYVRLLEYPPRLENSKARVNYPNK
jgi:hypothetical protein